MRMQAFHLRYRASARSAVGFFANAKQYLQAWQQRTRRGFPGCGFWAAFVATVACWMAGAPSLLGEEVLQNESFDQAEGLHWNVADDPDVDRDFIFGEAGEADLDTVYRGPLIWQELDVPVAEGQLIRSEITLASDSTLDEASASIYLDYETVYGATHRILLFRPVNSEVANYATGTVFETTTCLPWEAVRLIRFGVDRTGSGELWARSLSLSLIDSEDPIEIHSFTDLQKIGVDPEYPLYGWYVLAADIDASASATANGGEGWMPLGWPEKLSAFSPWVDDAWSYVAGEVFTGRFHGNGYAIQNLTINRLSSMQGLFGIVGGAEIRDVVLTNVSLTSDYAVGALAGLVGPGSLILNCSASGTVIGDNENIGGLVGMNRGSISHCHSSGTVTSTQPRWIGFNVGGLVGLNSEGRVTRSYSTAAVSGHAGVGGLVAVNDGGLVENCYATGPICHLSGGGLVSFHTEGTIRNCYALGVAPLQGSCDSEMMGGGALLNYASDTTTVVNSYWDMEIGDPQSTAGGEGRMTAEMTYAGSADTYVGWDFEEVWQVDTEGSLNNGYPVLREFAPHYELAVTSGSGGSVTVTPEAVEYRSGAEVSLQATAEEGYVFTGWTGDATGSSNPLTVVMDADKTIEASFRLKVVPELEPMQTAYSVAYADHVVLEVVASGAASYQWYAGESGDRENPVDGADDAELQVSWAAAGSYWVEVASADGVSVASDTVNVAALAQPHLILPVDFASHGSEAVMDQSITVSSNVAWTADRGDAAWITLVSASGEGDGSVIYALSLNPGGARTATITVTSGDLERTFTVEQAGVSGGSWHAGSSDLGNGWRWLPWLRSFSVAQDPWLYHPQHGWLFRSGDDPATGIYFWDSRQASFLYIRSDLYPTMYRFSDGKWVRYQIGSSNPRWFVDLLAGVWEQVE